MIITLPPPMVAGHGIALFFYVLIGLQKMMWPRHKVCLLVSRSEFKTCVWYRIFSPNIRELETGVIWIGGERDIRQEEREAWGIQSEDLYRKDTLFGLRIFRGKSWLL